MRGDDAGFVRLGRLGWGFAVCNELGDFILAPQQKQHPLYGIYSIPLCGQSRHKTLKGQKPYLGVSQPRLGLPLKFW
jgi:hypothetical protein